MRLPALLLAMAFVTYLPRLFPLLALSGRTLPEWVRRFLETVPIAVLAAFVGPLVLAPAGDLDLSLQNAELLAAVPTMAIALLTKNLLVTVVAAAVLVVLARGLV